MEVETKKETTWSASRIGCYKGCVLQFYYTYINKYISNEPVNTVYADKGTVFHETVENWGSKISSKEELRKVLAEECKKYNIIDGHKADYPKEEQINVWDETAALDRFFLFWEKYIQPKLDEGYIFKQESRYYPRIMGEKFVGALDLLLEPPEGSDKEVIVFDYKSGSSINVESYKLQQILYAYMMGLERGWDIPTTASKVKCYIFGPFMDQPKKYNDEEKMLNSILEIKYTQQEMEDIIKDYMLTINEIKSINWDEINPDLLGTYSYACNWCSFKGSVPDGEFRGCKCTYDKGFRQPRGLKFTKK